MAHSVCCSVLMCHAPIVVPEVGGADVRQCAATTEAMTQVGARVVEHHPDLVVVLSPHAPRDPASWSVSDDRVLRGDFSPFRAPEVALELPGDHSAAAAIARHAQARGVPCRLRRLGVADHGTLVPLYFLLHAGWHGPTVRLSLPYYPETRASEAMGRAVARAAAEAGQRWAFVASGDMSHRLEPGAPGGYHPRAHEFDDAVAWAVELGQYRRAVSLDPRLRELAAEDVVDALVVGAAAVGWRARHHQVLSYEGPFGVGYLVAVLDESDDDDDDRAESARPRSTRHLH
ncbi:hypothetical protein [Haliangium sp.]|uniref:DODA-type extradiol aromatic ring-opening family dioxygenase n=1 Tax=Haliangium sp. TaxID=2663208 RepID=UPI003D0CC1A4